MNISELLHELRNKLPLYILLKDASIAKISWLNPNENQPVFEILTTKPGSQETNIKNMVFLYKKLVDVKDLEQFLSQNYLKNL